MAMLVITREKTPNFNHQKPETFQGPSGSPALGHPGPTPKNRSPPPGRRAPCLPPCAESRQAKRNEDSMPSPGACSSRTNEGCWEVSLRGGEVMAKLRCSRDFTLRNVTFYDVMELNLPIVSEMAKKKHVVLVFHWSLSPISVRCGSISIQLFR